MSSLFFKGSFFGKSSLFTRILLRFFSFFLIYLFVVLFFSCSCGKSAGDPNGNNDSNGSSSSSSSDSSSDSGGDSSPDSGGDSSPDSEGGSSPDSEGGSSPDSEGGSSPDSEGGSPGDQEHTVGWGQAPDAPWTARTGFEVVVFKDKIWVLGGINTGGGGNPTDIIWNTSDGTNWTQVTPVGNVWAPRNFFQAEVFDGKMWVIGGSGSGRPKPHYKDIWNSSDGVNWDEVTPTGDWAAAADASPDKSIDLHQIVVHDNKMWLLGKFLDNEILQSSNGTNWTRVNVVGDYWPARVHHGAAAFDNKMWVVGGDDGSINFKDVWSSADGINWTEHTVAEANWKLRKLFEILPFSNELWIFGGRMDKDEDPNNGTNDVVYYNDVWSTTDGADWKEVAANTPWSGRTSFKVVEFKGNLWLLGGYDGTGALRDVWKFIP